MNGENERRRAQEPEPSPKSAGGTTDIPGIADELPLGTYLGLLRRAMGLSLRQVEDATKKEVSNAYLSQLENSRIAKPSPNVLYVLADQYGVAYEDLMRRAGYLPATPATAGRRQASVPTFAIKDLTPEEEKMLLEYLGFIRQQKK